MVSPEAPVAPEPFRTPAAWAQAMVGHIDELLLEQAHLEKKAAAGAIAFLFRLPPHAGLHRQLSALGREELVHFERTLKLMQRRGVAFERQQSSGYAEQLKKAVRKQAPERLCDELLIASIIEHRSHERMQLLAEALRHTAPEVAAFYADLCPSEDRHEALYVELAELVGESQQVARRRQQLFGHEADVLRTLPFTPRLHGGLPDGATT